MKTSYPGAKRVWFITDTHLGVRNNAVEWIDIMEDYFNNFFIPLVEANYKQGDILCHLGDVFDSRNAINLRVLDLGLSVFEKLSKIFQDGIIVIAGNHDTYLRTSNDINSIRPLGFIPNVNVYIEPAEVDFGGRKFSLMPWRKDHEEEAECVRGLNGEFLLCHADVQGMQFNKHVAVPTGCTLDHFKKFTHVWCGHIHYKQSKANVSMLGSPYELTRSDSGNDKGIRVFDLQNDETTYWVNMYSPKFVSIGLDAITAMQQSELVDFVSNNFVDVDVDADVVFKTSSTALLDKIGDTPYKNITFRPKPRPLMSLDNLSMPKADEYYQGLSISNIISEYSAATTYEPEKKDRLLTSLQELHRKANELNNVVD